MNFEGKILTELVFNTMFNSGDIEESASKELDKLRKKYGVPMEGERINSSVDSIFKKIKDDGFDRGDWNAPSSQTDRYDALQKAGGSNWKDGFMMVRDGNLMYPFINKNGKAMVSGIIAIRQRAGQHGPEKVFEVAGKVLEKIEKAEEEDEG